MSKPSMAIDAEAFSFSTSLRAIVCLDELCGERRLYLDKDQRAVALDAMLAFAASEHPGPVGSGDGKVYARIAEAYADEVRLTLEDDTDGPGKIEAATEIVDRIRAALATPSSDPIAGERDTLERAAVSQARQMLAAQGRFPSGGSVPFGVALELIARAALTGSEPSADAIAATSKGDGV